MRRSYRLAMLAVCTSVLAGLVAVAVAQTPPTETPVRQTPPAGPILPVSFVQEQPAAAAPTPVMPAQPGTVPAPVATSVPAAVDVPAPAAQPQAKPAPALLAVAAAQQPATESNAALEPTNPSGRQEPAVSIEWLGPTTAKVGQPTDCSIVVRNVCSIPVHQVLVRVRLTSGVNVVATEPAALAEDNIQMWEIGTLLPKQEKILQLRLMTPTRGDIGAQAWVTFTGSTTLKLKVREPKLVVKATGPEKATVGDATSFTLTVSNPGDGVTEMVKLHADLSDGLEHPRGRKVDFDLGNLNPGESRSVVVMCNAKVAGEQVCLAAAEADAGLSAQDKAVANVVVPRLDLEVKGPKLRYLDRKAVYTFKITNPGDAPAQNVTLNDVLPAGFKFLQADMGGRQDAATRNVSWFLGEIGPGQSREVNMEVACVNTGDFVHKLLAQASRGVKVEGELTTRVEGLSAIQVEMVDLEDPVEVNGETVYEIRITNTGSKTETDVKLVCTFPAEKMQFKTMAGPSNCRVTGNEIVFDPLPSLAPRVDAVYRVTMKCTAPGIAHFKARITSTVLTEPVTKEEATRIYTD